MDVEIMQKITRRGISALCAAALLFVGTTAASAALLTPPNALTPAPAEPDPAAGSIQVATISSPFAGSSVTTCPVRCSAAGSSATSASGSGRTAHSAPPQPASAKP